MRESIRIKICGVTDPDNAVACAQAGIHLIGLNFFAASPRSVVLEQAASIVEALRRHAAEVQIVGVFVNESIEVIQPMCQSLGLDAVQLSGDETWHDVSALAGYAYRALRPRTMSELVQDLDQVKSMPALRPELPEVLLDAWVPHLYGGTGQSVPSALTRAALREPIRCMVAGGLTPENVTEVFSLGVPWGVDVASGVEGERPGIKDVVRVRALVDAIRAWEERCQ